MNAADDIQPSGTLPDAARRWIPTNKQFFVIFFSYFALHVAIRTLISPHALELDEAEQVTLTQRWSWGYNSQPPLYCWLQMPLFHLFGTSVVALSLLKNTLLFFTYVFTWLAARQLTSSELLPPTAAASMLFFPEISWHSQFDRTHSVLVIMLASATLYLFLRVAARRALIDYLLLGLCGGLALLAKYNVIFFLAGLPLAAISVRAYRRAMLNIRMLASLGILLAIFLPNGLWMLYHPQLALITANKFKISNGAAGQTLIALSKVVLATCGTLGPLLLLHAAVLLRKDTVRPLKGQPPSFRLLWHTMLIVLLAVCIAVLVSGTTTVRDRWLQPVLGFAPILSLLYFESALNASRVRQILGIGAVVMIAVLIFLPARVMFADALKMPQRRNLPFDVLAHQVDTALAEATVVITDTSLTSGNLRLNLPGRLYFPPEFATLLATDAARVGVVWNATQDNAAPKNLADFLQKAGIDPAAAQPQYFSAPCRNSQTQTLRLAVVVLEKPKSGWPIAPEPP